MHIQAVKLRSKVQGDLLRAVRLLYRLLNHDRHKQSFCTLKDVFNISIMNYELY